MDEKASVVLAQLKTALATLKAAKPDERGELARRYAVTVTELEKVIAYFVIYVVDEAA